MTPHDPPMGDDLAASHGATDLRPALGIRIPNHLRPPWRDLPALAWLTVRQLDTRLQATPVLGRIAAWCSLPWMLLLLVCAHTDGHLAAKDRHAVLWIRRLSATGRGIHTRRALAISAAATAPLYATMLFATALGMADHSTLFTRIAALTVATTIVGALVLAIFAINGWRDLTTRTSGQHRRLAAHAVVPLVVAQGLAADTTTRAGIVLIRALRAYADQLGIGIAAVARDEHLIDGYRANGFVRTESDPTSRLLYRPPKENTSRGDGKTTTARRQSSQ
jgi:hypothetical protein